jgi:hypothetical protein
MRRIHVVLLLAIFLVVASTPPVSASEGISGDGLLTSPTIDVTDRTTTPAWATRAGDRTLVWLQLDDRGAPGMQPGSNLDVRLGEEGPRSTTLGHSTIGDSPPTAGRSDLAVQPWLRAQPVTISASWIHPGPIHVWPTVPEGAAGAGIDRIPMES